MILGFVFSIIPLYVHEFIFCPIFLTFLSLSVNSHWDVCRPIEFVTVILSLHRLANISSSFLGRASINFKKMSTITPQKVFELNNYLLSEFYQINLLRLCIDFSRVI